MKLLRALLFGRHDDTSEWWEINVSETRRLNEDEVPSERRFLFTSHVLMEYIRGRLGLREETRDVETVDTPTPPDR